MAPPLLTLSNIDLTFGGPPLFVGAGLSISAGEKVCLAGRNGSGKSTLMKLAAGLIEPDRGVRFLQPGQTIRYLSQEPDLSNFQTTGDYVADGLASTGDLRAGQRALERLGLSGQEEPRYLSGGEIRRAALARTLAPTPDILLLDEPTNHLDLKVIEWLEEELRKSSSAVVLVSHDRRFLENISKATIWIDRGCCRRHEKGFGHFETWRDQQLEDEEMLRHKLDRKIVRETRWLNRGVTARRKRNMGRLRALMKLREERKNQRRSAETIEMAAVESRRSGKRVIEANNISKAFGENVIVSDFSIQIQRGDRVGLVGPNGAGKTTLLSLLSGKDKPDKGMVTLGTNLDLVSLDQRRESLSNNTCLADVLTGKSGDSVIVGGQQKHVISYMKDFLFLPEQARTPVSALSGGERGRLMLARAFTLASNVLVLDEPTNDLDLETLDLLQELLADYSGTVIVVSHDRDFLDRVATSIIVAEGNGKWINYAGGYSDMLVQRGNKIKDPSVKATKTKTVGTKLDYKAAKRPKNKLSYKEKHALERLPAEIEKLQVDIENHHDTLQQHDLFNRDPFRFEAAAKDLEVAKARLAEMEERWLELEIQRDQIEKR